MPAGAAPTTPARGNRTARRRGLAILAILVAIAAIVWGVFHFLLAKPEQETDDAYVAGDVVSITARDPGTVLAIHADNTQTVRAGQPLLDLDPATVDVGLAAAEAELARAVRATRSDFSKVNETGAAVGPGPGRTRTRAERPFPSSRCRGRRRRLRRGIEPRRRCGEGRLGQSRSCAQPAGPVAHLRSGHYRVDQPGGARRDRGLSPRRHRA